MATGYKINDVDLDDLLEPAEYTQVANAGKFYINGTDETLNKRYQKVSTTNSVPSILFPFKQKGTANQYAVKKGHLPTMQQLLFSSQSGTYIITRTDEQLTIHPDGDETTDNDTVIPAESFRNGMVPYRFFIILVGGGGGGGGGGLQRTKLIFNSYRSIYSRGGSGGGGGTIFGHMVFQSTEERFKVIIGSGGAGGTGGRVPTAGTAAGNKGLSGGVSQIYYYPTKEATTYSEYILANGGSSGGGGQGTTNGSAGWGGAISSSTSTEHLTIRYSSNGKPGVQYPISSSVTVAGKTLKGYTVSNVGAPYTTFIDIAATTVTYTANVDFAPGGNAYSASAGKGGDGNSTATTGTGTTATTGGYGYPGLFEIYY